MKRSIVVLVLAVAIALTGFNAVGSDAQTPTHHAVPKTCTAQAFRPFSAAVWSHKGWERGNPPQNVLEALRSREACAPGPHKAAMKQIWAKDRSDYFVYRKAMIFRDRYTPYYGCTEAKCGWWAIPAWNVNCESKGGDASLNYYGNQEWSAYGGDKYAWSPEEASFEEQSIVATHMLDAVGLYQGWEEWEGGCA